MKNKFLKYCLIVFVVANFAACNSFQKKENQNYTSLKFERLIIDSNEYHHILHDKLMFDIEKDSAKTPGGNKTKLYLSELKLSSNTDDTLFIICSSRGELFLSHPESYNEEDYRWKNRLYDTWDTKEFVKILPNSFIIFYEAHFEIFMQDSMMFRYYFKTSKYKDSLMYHDVYYTFKNDSFVVVRQAENEK